MSPVIRRCRVRAPLNSAGEFAERVDVAFQIRETIWSRAVVQVLFTSIAGCADGEHARFDRLAAIQSILTANFEEAHVALAVIQVPFECGGHGDDAGGTQHASFFGERIRQARCLRVRRTEECVARFIDMRDGENFLIAEADETFAQARLAS